ncbi:hypothetical protein AB205_0016420 [Aquarana catesbeiana]|uniref:Uncharacterized protein n=1 Tax=Aquarana catesbeiana TaxID=8400 RepID=A0A2G9RZ68_AQUCT|nr:hypothetical protein AB205_0016420 [Aquarana catesbeiana]
MQHTHSLWCMCVLLYIHNTHYNIHISIFFFSSCFFTFYIFSLFSLVLHIFFSFSYIFFQNTILLIFPTHVECVVAIGHAMWRFSWLAWGSLPQLRNRQPFGVPSSSMLAKHSAIADPLLLYPTPDKWHIAMKCVEVATLPPQVNCLI